MFTDLLRRNRCQITTWWQAAPQFRSAVSVSTTPLTAEPAKEQVVGERAADRALLLVSLLLLLCPISYWAAAAAVTAPAAAAAISAAAASAFFAAELCQTAVFYA